MEAAPDQALARSLLRRGTAELARARRTRGAHRRTARRIARAQALLALAAMLAAAGAQRAEALRPLFLDPARPYGLDVGVDVLMHLAFADLDGDGDLDALAGTYDQHLAFFENSGSVRRPDFAAPVSDPFGLPSVGYLLVPALGDIDGDGDLDLFVGQRDGVLVFFANTGSATAPAFGAATSAFGIPDVGTVAAPALADVDGDGDLDLLVGEQQGHVSFFQNSGTASAPDFAAAVVDPFGLPPVSYYATPAFVDLDGDGDLDAMIGSYYGSVSYFENTGTAAAAAFASGGDTNPFGLELQPLAPGPSFADLDADGDADLLVSSAFGTLRFYRNTGTRTEPAFRPASRAFGLAAAGLGAALELGDLDGDGDLDGLTGDYDGNLAFQGNLGTRSSPEFGPGSTLAGLGGIGVYAAPALGDLDGDGDLDALVGDATGVDYLIYFENTGGPGAPAFAPAGVDPFCAGSLGNLPSPTFHDLDEDGDLDLFIGYDDGRLDFCRNDGTATAPAFGPSETNPFGLTGLGNNLVPAFADLNESGPADALFGREDGTLLLAFNSQTGAVPFFVPTPGAGLGLADLGFDSHPALGDVDGDGDVDALVAANDGNGTGYTTFFENLSYEPVCPPAPRPDCSELSAGVLTLNERKAGKERLALKLRPGMAGLAQGDLPDLTSSGIEAGLCLYDDRGGRVASLDLDRGGELCNLKPCWASIGGAPPAGKGFAYKDTLGGSAGVTRLVVRTGDAKATKLQAAASNQVAKGRTGLPTGLAALLLFSDGATVQLHVTGGACLSASFTEVKKREPDFFKAK